VALASPTKYSSAGLYTPSLHAITALGSTASTFDDDDEEDDSGEEEEEEEIDSLLNVEVGEDALMWW